MMDSSYTSDLRRLDVYESKFSEVISSIPMEHRSEAGVLLRSIPERDEWDEFIETVKLSWEFWQYNINQYPYCLLVFYGGIAFFEYDDNTFWPKLGEILNIKTPSTNKQKEFNLEFANIASVLSLKLLTRSNGFDYVGSAVYHIGIPLALWDGFLEVCKWVLYHEDSWHEYSVQDWLEILDKKVTGLSRLKKFIVSNLDTTKAIIKEVLDLREILLRNPDSCMEELARACFLRYEYFDEVPETAEFLGISDEQQNIFERPILFWNGKRSDPSISLQLPAVKSENLPAEWIIGAAIKEAAATSQELVLNADAFKPSIPIKFKTKNLIKSQRIKGIKNWALFNLDRSGQLVNRSRETLSLAEYILVTDQKYDIIQSKGFEEIEFDPLDDNIFYTILQPNDRYAELTIDQGGISTKLQFRDSSKIEAGIYYGRYSRASNFIRLDNGKVKTDCLPTIYISIPYGFFGKDEQKQFFMVDKTFQITVDAYKANGFWEKAGELKEDKHYYIWRWGKPPIGQFEKGIINDFRKLKDKYSSANLRGEHTFVIKSPVFTKQYNLVIDYSRPQMKDIWDIESCIKYILWFILCQKKEGMKWDEISLAKEIISPNWVIGYPEMYNKLKKYEEHGLIQKRNRYWQIAESRTVLNVYGDDCLMQYCGDPSIIWWLYRRMCYVPNVILPKIKVVNQRGSLPFLYMRWSATLKDILEESLKRKNVRIVSNLWG